MQMTTRKFYDDWIRTADLWCRKRPLDQLRHNHYLYSLQFVLQLQTLIATLYRCHQEDALFKLLSYNRLMFLNGPFSASFSLFTVDSKQIFDIKVCQ